MKILIESEEVKRILSLHRNENKKIQEQVSSPTSSSVKKTSQELNVFFTKAKTFGCLTDKNLDYNNFFRVTGDNRGYIKGPSNKNPGMVKRVYDDFSWEIIDPKTGQPLKKSVWKCDEIATNATAETETNNLSDAVLKEKKDKEGWMEYSELTGKGYSQLEADQGKYATEQFKLKTGKIITLYKPKTGAVMGGQQEGMSAEQKAFISKFEKRNGKLKLTPDEQASQEYRQIEVPGSKEITGWEKTGLKMWFKLEDIRNISGQGTDLQTTVENQQIPLDECKSFVDQFFRGYQDDTDIPDFELVKRKVQRCKVLYSPNTRTGRKNGWGMLSNQKNKIDVLSGLVTGEGPSSYGDDAKWRLK